MGCSLFFVKQRKLLRLCYETEFSFEITHHSIKLTGLWTISGAEAVLTFLKSKQKAVTRAYLGTVHNEGPQCWLLYFSPFRLEVGGKPPKCILASPASTGQFHSLFNIYSAHGLGPGKSICFFPSSFMIMVFSSEHWVSDFNDPLCCNIMHMSVLCIVTLH